ncbi:MAG: hypothetical protein AAGI48_10140 [Verrucomicrobiota bacterium]
MKGKLSHLLAAFATAGSLALSSCASDPYVQNAQTRGAVGGAGLGAIIGNNSGGIGQGEAMIAGALLGALFGESEYRKQNPRRY